MSFTAEKEFFEGKRPWSKIKDRVLGGYLVPYLNKVKGLGESIVVVDGFAGPGKYDDGSIGSPLMICQEAEKHVPDRSFAILVNENNEHKKKLDQLLKPFIERKKAVSINGNAEDLLKALKEQITTQTLFIYLDPFGLKRF
jgi:three-Cys-motif partner protein